MMVMEFYNKTNSTKHKDEMRNGNDGYPVYTLQTQNYQLLVKCNYKLFLLGPE